MLFFSHRVLLTAVSLASAALGQTQAPPLRPQFEVASIKPNFGMERKVSIGATSPGTFKAENVWLRFLIQMAWNVKDFQVSGGPGWAGSDRFDIVARTDGRAGFEQMRPMLQTLLEDRFRLVFHRESKELPVYALVAGRGGFKLHASSLRQHDDEPAQH
jgi:uncharacterized protein (TIGR03435 family)